jgi:hypothetical protein
MSQGIPYQLKGLELRYALDSLGVCSRDCELCKKKISKK